MKRLATEESTISQKKIKEKLENSFEIKHIILSKEVLRSNFTAVEAYTKKEKRSYQ